MASGTCHKSHQMQAALRLFNIKVSCECDAGKDDYSVTEAVAQAASKFLRTAKTLQPRSITVVRKSYDCRTPPKLRFENKKRTDSVSGMLLCQSLAVSLAASLCTGDRAHYSATSFIITVQHPNRCTPCR